MRKSRQVGPASGGEDSRVGCWEWRRWRTRAAPLNLGSDVDALPPHSLGGPPSEWVGLGSRRRFRFLFTVNCSLQASAGGLSGFPGLSEAPTRLALLPPRRGPGARPATTPTASRDSVPARTARVSGPGPTSNRARPWPARSPPLPAGVSASPEPPSRAWGQRCCSSPTGCCSGWRCLE